MSALRHGLRHPEPVVLEHLHKRKLLERGQPAHVHPAGAAAVLEVVAVVLDAAEGDAAESVDLEDGLGAGRGGDDVDVGLLAHADAVAG